MLKNMNFKKRLLIIIGIPLGICLILIAALIFLGLDIAKQADQIKQLSRNLNYNIKMIESMALLRQDSEKAKYYLPELESILPTRDQLVVFPGDVNIIARQNKFDANTSLGRESSGAANELGKIDFIISGQGEFNNVLNFLKLLKNSRYFIKINTIDLGRQNNDFKTLLTGQVFSF